MSNNSNNSGFNLIICHSSAARILSKRWGCLVEPWTIQMEPWACGVRCRVPGHRPIILSRKAFCEDFAESRKERARHCKVEAPLPGYPAQYRVKSQSHSQVHSVWLTGSVQTCTCGDFKRQKTAWGKGTCKHLIAVAVGYLGFNSFSEAVAVLKGGRDSWSKLTSRAKKHYPGLNPTSLGDWEEAEHNARAEETITVPSSGVSLPASQAYSNYVREEVRASYL